MLTAEKPFTHNGRYYAKGDEVPEDALEPDERANFLAMGKIAEPKAKIPKPAAPSAGKPAEQSNTK